ncbi:hypothetical protein MC885_001234 [Smutsia gigantea]|nr:hypothetical protein MC885_001234 [Smutsia gigantea]
MSTGTFCNFSTESGGASLRFPGIRLSVAGLASLFYYPVFRDYILWSGLCSAACQSVDFILSRPPLGQAVVILVGGAQESFQEQHYLTLRDHKGFVCLALRHGASLVPVYNFGKNDIFRLKASRSPSRNVWAFLLASSGAAVSFRPTPGACCPSRCPSPPSPGRKLQSAVGTAEASPLTCVSPLPAVGSPILVPQCLNPTQGEVDHHHTLYMKAPEQLSE